MIVVHEEGPLAEHLKGRNAPFRRLALPVYAGQAPKVVSIASAMVRNLPRLVGFLRRENIRIVHGNDLRMNLTWSLATKLAGRSSVWHQRALPYSASGLWRAIGFLSDHVIHVSDTVAKAMPATRHAPSSVIANPVAVPQAVPPRESAKAAIAREFGFDPGTTVIGFVGRLTSIKRPDVFVAAAARLAGCEPTRDSAFLMVGHDEEGMIPKLRKQALSMGIGDRIFFAGFRRSIEEWISGMDLLMATAERDSFGRTLIEAMTVGTPVVAACAGGHADIIEHGWTGLLVPPNDPDAFAAAVIRVLADRAFLGRLTEEARACAQARYSVRSHALRIMSIYDRLS